MKTPEDIKTGLWGCNSIGRAVKGESWCKENCPYMDRKFGCGSDYLREDALAYIQQLEDKVEELERVRADLKATNMELRDAVFKNELFKRRLEEERSAFEAQVPRWISVEERLPETRTFVIVAASENGDRYTVEAMLEHGRWVIESDSLHGDLYANNVTHWTPRLEPPKEE